MGYNVCCAKRPKSGLSVRGRSRGTLLSAKKVAAPIQSDGAETRGDRRPVGHGERADARHGVGGERRELGRGRVGRDDDARPRGRHVRRRRAAVAPAPAPARARRERGRRRERAHVQHERAARRAARRLRQDGHAARVRREHTVSLQKLVEIDTSGQTISMLGWWRHYWNDARLVWNPDQWGAHRLRDVPRRRQQQRDLGPGQHRVRVDGDLGHHPGHRLPGVQRRLGLRLEADGAEGPVPDGRAGVPVRHPARHFSTGSWSYHGYMVHVIPRLHGGELVSAMAVDTYQPHTALAQAGGDRPHGYVLRLLPRAVEGSSRTSWCCSARASRCASRLRAPRASPSRGSSPPPRPPRFSTPPPPLYPAPVSLSFAHAQYVAGIIHRSSSRRSRASSPS